MRKLTFYAVTICLLTFCMSDVKAVNTNSNNTAVAVKPAENEEVQAMLNRLQEIKAMDLSSMTNVQKKELRKEVKAIKQDMRAVTGIYLSVGALIIIILLLILLL